MAAAAAVVVLALVAKSLPELKSINLAGNNLASNITTDLYKTFVNHANITSIDVSNNDIRLGGPALVDLVMRHLGYGDGSGDDA